MKNISQTIKVLALAFILSFGLSYALAWVPPTATPPGGNVAAPINEGVKLQIKQGPLTVGSLTTAGTVTAGALDTGTLKVTTGAGASKVLTSDASGNATWQTPSSGADNLGDHTATQDLVMGANNITASGADSSYGAITVQGNKNNYSGINFRDASGATNYGTLMMHPSLSGFYNAADNGWRWYVNDAGNSVQSGTVRAADLYSTDAGGKYFSTVSAKVYAAPSIVTTTCNTSSAPTTCNRACPAGKYIVGGGCHGSSNVMYYVNSYPINNTTWSCTAKKSTGGGGALPFDVYAICR